VDVYSLNLKDTEANMLDKFAKIIILIGIILIITGIIMYFGRRIGLGSLPGDIVIRRKNLVIYIPIVSSIIISIILTIILNLLFRR